MFSTSPSKEGDAKRLGAHHFVISKDNEAMEKLKNSYDLILDTVSAEHPIAPLVNALKPRAVLALVGMCLVDRNNFAKSCTVIVTVIVTILTITVTTTLTATTTAQHQQQNQQHQQHQCQETITVTLTSSCFCVCAGAPPAPHQVPAMGLIFGNKIIAGTF